MCQLLCSLSAIFVLQTVAYITFDSGDEIRYDFYYQNQGELFKCEERATPYQSFTVNFAGTFERVPKVIFWPYYQNYAIEGNTIPCEVYLTKEVTTTSFTTSITCPKKRFIGFTFSWVAIDDDRIQVFDEFNKQIEGQASYSYTYTHSNPNFNKAFVSVISLGIGGPLSFNYTINQVTTTQVSVKFTTDTDKLTRIDYQVIVGVSEAFTMENLFALQAYETPPYDTGFIPVPADTYFLFPFAGVYYDCVLNLRQNRTTLLLNSAGVQYKYEGWGASKIDLTIRKVWMKKSIAQVFTPLLCKKMRVTRIKQPDVFNSPLITVTIQELNILNVQTYSQQLLLDQTQLTLTLQVVFQCSIGYRVQGNVTKCTDCDQTIWNLSQNCYSGGNQVVYTILLIQQSSVYQKIKVDVQPYYLTITQDVINQKPETYSVAKLEIVRN